MGDCFEPAARVRTALGVSELVRAVRSVTADHGRQLALGDAPVRPLTSGEIAALELTGNRCGDWSRVRVADPFDPARIHASQFLGDVWLGSFRAHVELPGKIQAATGVYRSVVADCVVGHDALVQDVRMLARVVVAPDAVLWDCGAVTADGHTTFGNGQEIPVALETGGREVKVFAELDVEVAANMARSRHHPERLAEYHSAVADYVAAVQSPLGIVESHATVRSTPSVRNCYVGPYAVIDGATAVADSTLLSNKAEPVHIDSGAFVRHSVMQWGSHASTMAIVDRSVMTEHSHVERHGMVTSSILGPNTGVAEGEVTASLLGPFVGFHHQALLIAALWPEGKGNVGYGANVGSNHTSKAPDQEFWPGEGAFLGLGVNIKYPADLSRAPYSIIASGVTTLPQKVTFPFSLINKPAAVHRGVSLAHNEIIPAWLLTDNMFTLRRNEAKYKARNRATRTRFVFDVFRSDIVQWMIDACRRLESVRETRDVYTDRDIEGLGKNFMVEASRRPAIDAYRFYVEYYALMGLLERVRRVRQAGSMAECDRLLRTASPDPVWEQQRAILHDQVGLSDWCEALGRIPRVLEKIALDVERSKAKDDERGIRIIDDYSDVHGPARDDRFVRQTWDEARTVASEVESLIALAAP